METRGAWSIRITARAAGSSGAAVGHAPRAFGRKKCGIVTCPGASGRVTRPGTSWTFAAALFLASSLVGHAAVASETAVRRVPKELTTGQIREMMDRGPRFEAPRWLKGCWELDDGKRAFRRTGRWEVRG